MQLRFQSYKKAEKKYIKQISTCDWTKLEAMWADIKSRKVVNGWPMGKALEYMFIRAFDLENADVVYPYSNRIINAEEQIDGFIFLKDIGVGFIVECKDWSDSVSFDEVAKLHSRLLYRPSTTFAIFVSINGFTPSATELIYMMHPHCILFWNQTDIDECFKNRKFVEALIYKYQFAMMSADPYITVFDGKNI